jgi:hypothetical protein
MKHLTRKITIGLLATTLSLSAKDPSPSYSILDLESVMLKESAAHEYVTEKGAEKLDDPKLLTLTSLNEEFSSKLDLFSSSHTKQELKTFKKIYKQELKTLKKIYKQLLEDHATLSEGVIRLKLEQAVLKAENDAYKEEKKTTWERFKNWFFKLDTTKVLASIVSGTFTLIAALLAILL